MFINIFVLPVIIQVITLSFQRQVCWLIRRRAGRCLYCAGLMENTRRFIHFYGRFISPLKDQFPNSSSSLCLHYDIHLCQLMVTSTKCGIDIISGSVSNLTLINPVNISSSYCFHILLTFWPSSDDFLRNLVSIS